MKIELKKPFAWNDYALCDLCGGKINRNSELTTEFIGCHTCRYSIESSYIWAGHAFYFDVYVDDVEISFTKDDLVISTKDTYYNDSDFSFLSSVDCHKSGEIEIKDFVERAREVLNDFIKYSILI